MGLYQPLSRQRVCPSPQNRGGGAHSPAGEGLGESHCRRLEKKLSTLPIFYMWVLLYKSSLSIVHCKGTVPKLETNIPQNETARPRSHDHISVSIYIIPQSVCLFGCSKEGRTDIGDYINRSQKHECGNWEQGRQVSFLGIHKSDLVCSMDPNTGVSGILGRSDLVPEEFFKIGGFSEQELVRPL